MIGRVVVVNDRGVKAIDSICEEFELVQPTEDTFSDWLKDVGERMYELFDENGKLLLEAVTRNEVPNVGTETQGDKTMKSDAEFAIEANELLAALENKDATALVALADAAGRELARAKTAAAHAKLDKELAVATAYTSGQVVGGNSDARAACAEGLVGRQSRVLLDAEANVLELAAHLEAIRYAKQLMVAGGNNANES